MTTGTVIDLGNVRHQTENELKQAGVDINACYQCKRCTAGCPMLSYMKIGPNRVIRMLQTGQENKVLQSSTIWLCASCQTCTTRCPNDIEIAHMMDILRQRALAQNIPCPEKAVYQFHRAFIKEIARGRVHELGIIARYKLATGRFTDDMKLGMEMFRRGRIKLIPSRLTKSPAVKALFQRAAKGGEPWK